MSKEEADRLAKEAESHASEDKQRLSEVEARNRLDNLVYQTEKLIKENREKLADTDVKAVESAIEESRRALAEGGVEKLNAGLPAICRLREAPLIREALLANSVWPWDSCGVCRRITVPATGARGIVLGTGMACRPTPIPT